jgi:hypothetical protein
MSPTNPISLAPLITESERVIAEAIKHFGLTADPARIVITIQSKGRKNALGWFGANHWKNGKPEALHEINLSAEYLKTHNMGETLIHELAHAENKTLGIQDCSGRRHNKKFKAMAEKLGLEVKELDPAVGYGFTDLADGARAFLEKIVFKRELFELCRLQAGSRAKAGSRLIKCECPNCSYTVRVTRKWLEVGAPTCPCGETMEAAE